MKEPTTCFVCGKSFRGWEPLTDGNGRYYHRKCLPKIDHHALQVVTKKALENLTHKEVSR